MHGLETINALNEREAIKGLLLSAEEARIPDQERIAQLQTALEEGPGTDAWDVAVAMADDHFLDDEEDEDPSDGIPERFTYSPDDDESGDYDSGPWGDDDDEEDEEESTAAQEPRWIQ